MKAILSRDIGMISYFEGYLEEIFPCFANPLLMRSYGTICSQ